MKEIIYQKIKELFKKNTTSFPLLGIEKIIFNSNEAAEEIVQFMCNREARAIYNFQISEFSGIGEVFAIHCVERYLHKKGEYSKKCITLAIEMIK